MSAIDHGEARHEIIIVKRNHDGHDDGHHGGVWKIAFADFMTAMMCFFLVMWLINAANEQTKAAVASYFNPVELIDRNSSRKGLEDLGDGPSK
ncbi:MAG: MotB family protein, partial [Mesorhizobium sp.]